MKAKITLEEWVRKAIPDATLMTLRDALQHLGWTFTDTGEACTDIHCSCGAKVKLCGWLGNVDCADCPDCDKGMQDMTGLLPAGQACMGMVDPDEVEIPESGAIWLPQKIRRC